MLIQFFIWSRPKDTCEKPKKFQTVWRFAWNFGVSCCFSNTSKCFCTSNVYWLWQSSRSTSNVRLDYWDGSSCSIGWHWSMDHNQALRFNFRYNFFALILLFGRFSKVKLVMKCSALWTKAIDPWHLRTTLAAKIYRVIVFFSIFFFGPILTLYILDFLF